MFLIDTNVFLEILLNQSKKENCKTFLNKNINNLNISDFSLHSIGVILFKYDKEDIFERFAGDVISNVRLLSLPKEFYGKIAELKKNENLDFDDAYQYSIAKIYKLKLVTMD